MPQVDQDLLARLDALLAEGERERLLSVFLAEVGPIPLRWSSFGPRRSGSCAWPRRTRSRGRCAEESYRPDSNAFASLSLPALVLLGSESPEWAKEGAEVVQFVLPDSRVAVLEGQGHIALMTAPELVADEVARFLDE